MLEHLGSELKEFFLCLSDRCYQLFSLCTWLRQCLGVHLTIGSQRHLVKLHIGCWYHIVCKLLGQVVTQCITVYLAVSGIVGTEVLHTTNLLDLNTLHPHTFVLADEGFNLTQLNTEATQLHLVVDSSHVLYLAFAIVFHEVAGMVHLSLHKRTVNELLCGEVFALPVATGNLRTCHAQLTGNTLWNELSHRVEDECREVVEWSTDRYILIVTSVLGLIERSIDGKLRRTIGIDKTALTVGVVSHLLSTNNEVVNGQVGELL